MSKRKSSTELSQRLVKWAAVDDDDDSDSVIDQSQRPDFNTTLVSTELSQSQRPDFNTTLVSTESVVSEVGEEGSCR